MSGTNLGSAYVTIMPSAKGISGKIESALRPEAASAGNSAGGLIGKNIGGTLMKTLAGIGIGVAIKNFFSDAINAGGDLQQSFGGLETIYGEAAAGMKELSYEAAKAGISANSYAEQAVSFGASLKQAYGSDLKAAATAANTAILDMADNSAKMGTDLSSIQNAYQGFAKQNYTMLDNLKLGYGGTKKEMQRLLEDAQKLSGVEYNIDNLGDVYQAIHVIQEELGVAGVAAAEAEGTFTGSSQAMKAAWENLKADIALGKDITEDFQIVATSAKNFFMNNLLPMIGNVLKGLPTLVGEWLKNAFDNLPGMIDTATTFITNLADGIRNNGGTFITGLTDLLSSAWTALSSIDWLSFGASIIDLLWAGIQVVAPKIWEGIKTIAAKAAEFFGSINWPEVGEKALKLIGNAIGSLGRLIWDGLASIGETAKEKFAGIDWSEAGANAFHTLVDGIANIASILWEAITTIGETAAEHFKGIDWPQVGKDILTAIGNGITAVGSFVWEAMTTIGTNAMNFFQNVDWENAGSNAMKFIINGIKNLASNIWEALKTIGKTAGDNFSQIDWKQVGMNVINFIVTGIKSIGSFIWGALKTLADEAWNGLCSIDWLSVGSSIVNGIVSGITSMGSAIADTLTGLAKNAWTSLKDFFSIGSPSKLMRDTVGKWIPLGIAEGIEMEAGAVTDAISGLVAGTAVNVNAANYQPEMAAAGGISLTFNVYGAYNPEEFASRALQQLKMEMRIA